MLQEQEKTSDNQLDNLNKQKQDLERQIVDLKGQVLDKAKKEKLKRNPDNEKKAKKQFR